MSFLVNKAKKAIGKKLKKVLFKIIKPILPFLLLILVVILSNTNIEEISYI